MECAAMRNVTRHWMQRLRARRRHLHFVTTIICIFQPPHLISYREEFRASTISSLRLFTVEYLCKLYIALAAWRCDCVQHSILHGQYALSRVFQTDAKICCLQENGGR